MSQLQSVDSEPVPTSPYFEVPVDSEQTLDLLTRVTGDSMLASEAVEQGVQDFVYPLLSAIATNRYGQKKTNHETVNRDHRIVTLELQGCGGASDIGEALNGTRLNTTLYGNSRRDTLDKSRQRVIDAAAGMAGFEPPALVRRLSGFLDGQAVFSDEELRLDPRFLERRISQQEAPVSPTQLTEFRKYLGIGIVAASQAVGSESSEHLVHQLFEVKPADQYQADSTTAKDALLATIEAIKKSRKVSGAQAFDRQLALDDVTLAPLEAMLSYEPGEQTVTAFGWMLRSVAHADEYMVRRQLITVARKIALAA